MLRRQRWLILGTAVIVAVAAGVFASIQTPVYTATTTVLLRPNDPTESLGNADAALDPTDLARYVAGQAIIVRSLPVAQEAAKRLPKDQQPKTPEEVRDLLDDVAVQSSDLSNVIAVLAHGSTAERARNLSDAFAEAYIANRKNFDIARLQGAIDALQTKL